MGHKNLLVAHTYRRETPDARVTAREASASRLSSSGILGQWRTASATFRQRLATTKTLQVLLNSRCYADIAADRLSRSHIRHTQPKRRFDCKRETLPSCEEAGDDGLSSRMDASDGERGLRPRCQFPARSWCHDKHAGRARQSYDCSLQYAEALPDIFRMDLCSPQERTRCRSEKAQCDERRRRVGARDLDVITRWDESPLFQLLLSGGQEPCAGRVELSRRRHETRRIHLCGEGDDRRR